MKTWFVCDEFVFGDINDEVRLAKESDNFLCDGCRYDKFELLFEDGSAYPLLKCAGCSLRIGHVAWAFKDPIE